MHIVDNKQIIRKQVEELRFAMSDVERQKKQRVLNQKLIDYCQQNQFQSVMVYMPFRSEPDIMPYITWCWETNIQVSCPRVVHSAHKMTIYEIKSEIDLETKRNGLREPIPTRTKELYLTDIEMVIVPGLAFDEKCGRLGYGGGFYDRFFTQYDKRGIKTPVKISVAFDLQILPEIPMASHDVRVDMVFTESDMILGT